jgi:hypothetical protein
MRRVDLFFEETARHRLPPPDELELNIHDANWVAGTIMHESWAVQPGPIEEADGRAENKRLVDYNEDGMVSPVELEIYREFITRLAAVNPRPVRYDKRMPAFISDIRSWADQDLNGELDTGEIFQSGSELWDTIQGGYSLPAWTPIGRFFDRNRDGHIDELEKEWAVDFSVDLLLRTAVERGVEVWDHREQRRVTYSFDADGDPSSLSEEELNRVRHVIPMWEHEFYQEKEPNETDQRWLDSDGNGTVERREVNTFSDRLMQALLNTWLRIPEEEANSIRVRSALDEAADADGDGLLSMEEREVIFETLAGPHEVRTAFGGQIDFDGNGELSMDELHRAKETGSIPAGTASAERRIASLSADPGEGMRVAPEAGDAVEGRSRAAAPRRSGKVKAVSTWGSSLAVLGVRDMSEKMDASQTDLIVSFLENAFVNYGNVTVVDRQNLEKIMEEYKYQTSALVDEETAVEIGKLSGADAIAIGNLSRLADTYYLHLKVINVQSGAIIGSSISEGASEKDFLGMCNGAVEPLF